MVTMTQTRKNVANLALIIYKRYAADWAEYQEARAEAHKDGYRPQYCFHGVSQWTDYDPMCGMCEDHGNYFDPATYRGYALDEAKRAYATQDKRVQMLTDLMREGAPMQIAELGAWATEPVQKYLPESDRKTGYAALAKVDSPF